jgi:hypothetical protein
MNQFNESLGEGEVGQPRTKEEAQQELEARFGMRKTADFQTALQRGEIEKAEAWLQYIIDNRDAFPQYKDTWASWLSDRQRDIVTFKDLWARRGAGEK